jgi:hypothetical protein
MIPTVVIKTGLLFSGDFNPTTILQAIGFGLLFSGDRLVDSKQDLFVAFDLLLVNLPGFLPNNDTY